MQQPDVLQVKRVLWTQLIVGLIAIAVALPFGAPAALSALIGAAVCLLANMVFAFWVFRKYRAQDAGLLVMRMYGAEMAKIVLILFLFAVAFATIEGLNLPALLGAYFAVQVLSPLLATQLGARETK